MESNSENIFDTINDGVAETSETVSEAINTADVASTVSQAVDEGLSTADEAVTEGIVDALDEEIDKEELNRITEEFSDMIDQPTQLLNQVEGATGNVLGAVNGAVSQAGNVALSNINAATRLTMSAQDVLRMSFDELEEKIVKASLEYAKKKALGIAHNEFSEQMALYYQVADLVERLVNIEQTAQDTVDTAKNTIKTTKSTIKAIQKSLTTLQNAVKVAVDLLG